MFMRKTIGKALVVGVVAALTASGFGPDRPAEAAAFKDTEGHWAEETIQWGAETGIANGFPDGTFLPNGAVTEAQFTAMLFRAFPESAPAEKKPYWYTAYYDVAESWLWPVDEANAAVPLRRGQVAQIVAAAFGTQLSVEDAVDFLLDRGLASGRLAENGRIDFGETATLTRAEAVQFVRNATSSGLPIGKADKAPSSAAKTSDAPVSVSGIAVGDSVETLLAAFGEPARKEASEYGFTWYVYNGDYKRFSMFGVKDGSVKALYANGANMSLKSSLGDPLSFLLKGNTRFLIDSDGEYDVFDAGTAYVTVFYDVHENRAVSAVQAIEKKTEQALVGFYGKPSEALAGSFERLSLELANSARAKRGLPALEWDDGAANVAEGHSEDMAANDFFDHTNLKGEGLGERLTNGGVPFRSAGENIAYGQTNAIFAHEGWMNSEGHRKNLLGAFERLGVGVRFSEDDAPYYTQNFLTK
ncbi:CAP-associated domain-containing protein [Paenibacillus sp.]|uniref:CAP-associated domain-containing protein n=1 Tax=Paenibacillus sp. TaxID=58172 RepID=UPI002811DBE2|nr:CAP-associated domain-containing protein [Paenibacillus sp.]